MKTTKTRQGAPVAQLVELSAPCTGFKFNLWPFVASHLSLAPAPVTLVPSEKGPKTILTKHYMRNDKYANAQWTGNGLNYFSETNQPEVTFPQPCAVLWKKR